MSGWSWWWLSWVCAGVVAELYVVALGDRRDRLSQNVWEFQATLPGDPFAWRILTGVLLLFLAWHLSVGARH